MRSFAITIAIIGLIAPEASLADAPRLDSREYKLMLEPKHFIGDDPQDAIKQIADMIQALIADHVSRKAAAEFSSKDFDLDEQRAVRFWDTAACDFDKSGFALRERSNLDDQGNTSADRELTLKFRGADLFLVAQTPLPAMQGAKKPESKFEEDVAPLAVRTDNGVAVVADPPSTRSLYSRSTKQQVKVTNLPDTLEDAAKLFPTLADSLVAGGTDVDMSGELTASETFTERVYESPKFSLGEDTKTSYSLTLWYKRPGNRRQPALAEISFKYDTSDDGGVPRKVAQRALNLYRAMLGLVWAKPDAPTKTAIVSPSACAD